MKKLNILAIALLTCNMNASAEGARQYKAGEIPDANDIARMLGGHKARSQVQHNTRPPLSHRGISLNSSPAAAQQKQMTSAAVEPQQEAQNMTVNSFALPIQFGLNSAKILNSALPQLDAVASGLQMIEDPLIVIEGHTDASGNGAYNKSLSKKRALAVKRYFMKKYGFQSRNFIIVGKGADSLINARNPYAAENRRVEFRAAQ